MEVCKVWIQWGGGLFPVSMSISMSSVLPMSPLPLEIMLSNRLHRSLNLPFVSSLIGASFRSTFLCVSTSAGNLMKFVAIVKTLCRSVSVLMAVNWANNHLVRSGTQFLVLYLDCLFQILHHRCRLSLQRLRHVSLVDKDFLCC